MRPLWKDVLAAIWLGMIIPGIVLHAFVLKERHRTMQDAQPGQAEQVQILRSIPVRDPDGIRSYMDLETYLTGVMLAEIPASFHPEALKAQSVAARTYAWKAYSTGGKHGDGSICTDSSCCQAYLTEEAYLFRGGTQENLEKVRSAVDATDSIVLLYDSALIEATYFSASNGSTETALAVWGADYPYLQAVSSPEETVVHTVTYSKEDFEQLLGIQLPKNTEEWFGAVIFTEGGGVATMEIAGETHSGVQLRSQLGLRSTDFEILPKGDSVTITTHGYGHRVGMSQHGANAMAEQGSCWQQILQHYYPGTVLAPIS